MFQRTIAEKVSCTGIGLHSGSPVELTLHPARAGTGVVFERTDVGLPVEVPAASESVTATLNATTLGRGGTSVGTVEHLLAALYGLGVDNVRVEVHGPELPVMDGSAAPFVYLIQQAGLRPQRRVRRRMVIHRPIEVRDGNRWVRVIPSREFRISATIDFAHPAIGVQSLHSLTVRPETFARALAPARTFGFLGEVQALQSAGLAQGGSLQNAVVLDDARVLNREGLRFPDEFVRHKALDLVGDLSLLGLPVQGHFKVMRGGHALHQALVSEIRANPACWTVEVPERTGSVPAVEPASVPRWAPATRTG